MCPLGAHQDLPPHQSLHSAHGRFRFCQKADLGSFGSPWPEVLVSKDSVVIHGTLGFLAQHEIPFWFPSTPPRKGDSTRDRPIGVSKNGGPCWHLEALCRDAIFRSVPCHRHGLLRPPAQRQRGADGGGAAWLNSVFENRFGFAWQNRLGIPFWLVGEFTTRFRTYFRGDWDVLWGNRGFDPWPFGWALGCRQCLTWWPPARPVP